MSETQALKYAKRAKEACRALALLSHRVRAEAIITAADALLREKANIFAANEEDCAAASNLPNPLLDRLRLSEKTFAYMQDRMRKDAALPDPLGVMSKGHIERTGLRVYRTTVPLGVIAVIYESRPNVTTDAASVCIKSGNALILRGGSEALRTNTCLAGIIAKACAAAGLPEHAVQIVDSPERGMVSHLLKQRGLIDAVVPRGGKSLIELVAAESLVPVIKHYEGICHLYLAPDADISMAVAITVNSKCQKVEVCNALETLLVDEAIAASTLPEIGAALRAKGVELRGCPRTRAILDMAPAIDEDWRAEYLAPILSIKVVEDIGEAIAHIAAYGSGHTDGIVTSSIALAERFVAEVDSASVLVNASTRLSGGGDYGMGGVIGISTDKLHARGPVGPEELTSYKWVAYGSGQLRS